MPSYVPARCVHVLTAGAEPPGRPPRRSRRRRRGDRRQRQRCPARVQRVGEIAGALLHDRGPPARVVRRVHPRLERHPRRQVADRRRPAIVTESLTPSKLSAPPFLPGRRPRRPVSSCPCGPCPWRRRPSSPLASSNAYAATGAGPAGARVVHRHGDRSPPSPSCRPRPARSRSACASPAVAAVASQTIEYGALVSSRAEVGAVELELHAGDADVVARGRGHRHRAAHRRRRPPER